MAAQGGLAGDCAGLDLAARDDRTPRVGEVGYSLTPDARGNGYAAKRCAR